MTTHTLRNPDRKAWQNILIGEEMEIGICQTNHVFPTNYISFRDYRLLQNLRVTLL
jgi:hypothetical protein